MGVVEISVDPYGERPRQGREATCGYAGSAASTVSPSSRQQLLPWQLHDLMWLAMCPTTSRSPPRGVMNGPKGTPAAAAVGADPIALDSQIPHSESVAAALDSQITQSGSVAPAAMDSQILHSGSVAVATASLPAAQEAQQLPSRPNAAVVRNSSPAAPHIAGTKLPCLLQPGMNAAAASPKQTAAIHWWNTSSASQLRPSAGK